MNNKIKTLITLVITFETLGLIVLSVHDIYDPKIEGQVDLKNTTCTLSAYLGRKIFLHICLKEKRTVYDVRYFWTEEGKRDSLKPSVIGVQMTSDEFLKICNYCSHKE